MRLKFLEMFMLLLELLLQLMKLLLLSLANLVIFVCLLALGESISTTITLHVSHILHPPRPMFKSYLARPLLAPVAPSAIARDVVVKAARDGIVERSAGRTAFTSD